MLKHCLHQDEALPLGQSRPSELAREPGQQMEVRRVRCPVRLRLAPCVPWCPDRVLV